MMPDELQVIGTTELKCPECGGEVFSTPMPVGKINYLPGRSMISNRPDIEIHDAEMMCICTKCKEFVSLRKMKTAVEKKQDGKTEGKEEKPESPENSESQEEKQG